MGAFGNTEIDVIMVDDQLTVLWPDSISTDISRFEALVRTGSEADLREAVGLAEGEFMSGIDVEEANWEELAHLTGAYGVSE